MENCTILDSLLSAANMPAKPIYSASDDLPIILNLPRRQVMGLIRGGHIACLEITRRRRTVTHAGLSAAVQGFVRAANDEGVGALCWFSVNPTNGLIF